MKRVRIFFEGIFENFRLHLLSNFSKQINEIEKEGLERNEKNEVAIFANPVIRIFVFVALILAFQVLCQFLSPPLKLKERLKGQEPSNRVLPYLNIPHYLCGELTRLLNPKDLDLK